MAVLALAFVGEAIGASIGGTVLGITAASIGGFIGAQLGGLIDNMLFPNKQTGPRLTDLSVQASTYGQAIPKLYGPDNRIAGNVIYSSKLIETIHKKHVGKGGPSTTVTTYTYSVNLAIAIADARRKPLVGIKKIWMNSKLEYSAAGSSGSIVPDPITSKLYSSMTFYDGSFTQLPDPNLETALGIGNVAAYRGTSYVVIWGLQLADFGNRTPNIEFLVEADDKIDVSTVLLSIANDCGIDPNSVSSSSISGELTGYAIGAPASGTAAIQPLALAYNFDTASVGGGLRFQNRLAGYMGTIEPGFLAGHQDGQGRPELIRFSRSAETQMPQQATITFADPARDYQVNAQTATATQGSANSNLNAQVPIVLDVAHGAKLADRLLWEAWNMRDTAIFQGDDRLINLEAGRTYVFTTPAGLEPWRVKTKSRGANGVIQVELTRDRSEVYRSGAFGTPANVLEQTIDVPLPTDLFLIDSPILQDADDDTGFYYVVDGQVGWRGADVVRSIDGGGTYTEVAPVGRQSVLGTAAGLGAGTTDVVDSVNVIDVVLDDPTDELTSVSDLELLSGSNACWIGGDDGEDGEILQFKTATLIAAGHYHLSGLLRGRLGTEYAVGTHSSGDRFVLLTVDALERSDYGPGDWTKTREYKAVSLLLTEADATPRTFTNSGEGKRPLSPVHVTGSTDVGTGDTTIAWVRRSRLRQPGLGIGPLPLGESTEAYEIDVYYLGVLKRTIAGLASPTVVYSAAERTIDTGAAHPVQIQIFQMSDVRGRGRPGLGTI